MNDKELLLKDLSGRLPYRVKASYYGAEEEQETWDEIEGITLDGYVDIGQYNFPVESVKPYLFPLSSMTEEQKKFFKDKPVELDKYGDIASKDDFGYNSQYTDLDIYLECIDWLNTNHFDYRGLIEKSLALDATNLGIYE